MLRLPPLRPPNRLFYHEEACPAIRIELTVKFLLAELLKVANEKTRPRGICSEHSRRRRPFFAPRRAVGVGPLRHSLVTRWPPAFAGEFATNPFPRLMIARIVSQPPPAPFRAAGVFNDLRPIPFEAPGTIATCCRRRFNNVLFVLAVRVGWPQMV